MNVNQVQSGAIRVDKREREKGMCGKRQNYETAKKQLNRNETAEEIDDDLAPSALIESNRSEYKGDFAINDYFSPLLSIRLKFL